MEDSEKNRYIEFLIQQKEERERTIADKDVFIKNLQETLDMLKTMHESDSKKIDDLMASHEQDCMSQPIECHVIKLFTSLDGIYTMIPFAGRIPFCEGSVYFWNSYHSWISQLQHFNNCNLHFCCCTDCCSQTTSSIHQMLQIRKSLSK